MPRLAIIVDHPQRDLAGLMLTAFWLCQQGVTCHLVPLNLQERELWALAPDFVLLNFARSCNAGLAAQLGEAGIEFGILDTEGGVWASLDQYSELLWTDGSLRRQVKCVCAWGKAIADHVVEKDFFNRSQVMLTGCPRFDLYHRRWRSILSVYSTEESRTRKRILINTNFSVSNPRFASVESHIEHFQRDIGWPFEKVMKMLKAGAAGMGAAVELARNLGHDFPLSEIVLRPHPFESDEYYRRKLAKLENVTVDGLGPVQPQIYQADVVIQRSCSTAIEAGMASVPTLSPQWVPAEMEVPVAEEVSIPCTCYRELRVTLEEILNGGYQPPATTQRSIGRVIGAWFHSADGFAHQRAGETVLSYLKGARRVDERLCAKRHYGLGNGSKSNLRYLGGRVRHDLRLSPDWSFRHMKKIPSLSWATTNKFFGAEEVRELADRVHRAFDANGLVSRPVQVEFARERGDYLQEYFGHSITLNC